MAEYGRYAGSKHSFGISYVGRARVAKSVIVAAKPNSLDASAVLSRGIAAATGAVTRNCEIHGNPVLHPHPRVFHDLSAIASRTGLSIRD